MEQVKKRKMLRDSDHESEGFAAGRSGLRRRSGTCECQTPGSVFASSGHLFPRLFPAFRNSRTGTTAARISSIKTFSRRSYTLMPREGGAGSGVPARVHDQTPQLWSLSAPIIPETTRVRSPVSLGVPVKSASEMRDGDGGLVLVRRIGRAPGSTRFSLTRT